MSWRSVPFAKAVQDATGGNVKIQRKDYLVLGLLPIIDQGQQDVAGYTDDRTAAYRGEVPVVLFGDHTRALKYVDRPFALGADGVKVLEAQPGFDAKFLYYYLLSCDIPNHGYSRHFKFLKELNVPAVAPSEQHRIVEILDQAHALRRRAREADAKAARILPALFLKMFGDPATNPMGWPVKPLSEAVDRIEAGWSAGSETRERRLGEFGVLKVSAVTSGTFLPKEYKTVPSVPDSRSLVTPKRGDLLFSRANTRELVAATCLVDTDYPYLFLSDKLWRLVPRGNIATTPYLRELMACEVVRDKFRAFSSGSSGSMLNVSQASVLRTEVPLAPPGLQKKFERYTWDVLGLLRVIHQARTRLDTLRGTLLQRAFSGQLTAKWRAAHSQQLLAEMQEQARLLNLSAPSTVLG